MHQINSFESDIPKENSFVFLQILPGNPSHSTTQICTQEIAQKIFSLNDFSTLTQSLQDPGCSSQSLIEKDKINAGISDLCIGLNDGNNDGGIRSITTHVEIIDSSQNYATSSKVNPSKVEGRKAPGSNRILPLITSVWEDGDLLRKRQRSPKGSKRESKGKGPRSTKRLGLGGIDIEEVSDEEDWVECEEKDFCGGDLHTAYSHFFMAEEGGEDREDCICGECGAEFLTATQVAHHLQSEHHKREVKLFQCFVCRRKRYPALVQLNQHLSNAHGIPRPELTCRTCFMELAGESEAKAHSRKHETPYTCSRCSLSLSQMGFLLAEHLREVHLPKERPFPCYKCGRRFLHQFARDLHMLRRHQRFALVCPEIRLSESVCSLKPHKESGGIDSTRNASTNDSSLVLSWHPVKKLNVRGPCLEGAGVDHGAKDMGFPSCGLENSFLSPEDSRVASQPICSMGSFSFPNEVSLLRHVFQCHDKTLQIQLLKWAREVDREDALFEELWKAYSKGWCKGGIGVVDDMLSSTGSDNAELGEAFHGSALATSAETSTADASNAVNPSNVALGSHAGFVKCSSLLLPSDLAGNSPTTISINTAKLSRNRFTKVSLPRMPQILPCHNVTLSINPPSLTEQSSMPIVPLESFVNNENRQSIPCSESSELISFTIRSGDLIETDSSVKIDSAVHKAVSECMMDILDSICNVLDKRSALKESKKPAAAGGTQRNVSSVRCLLCRYLACNPMALERHRRRRHFRNRRCPFCSLTCASVDSVWKHVSDVHLSSTKKSKAEGILSTADAELQPQGQIQKPSIFSSGLRCPECKKVFPTRGKCNYHQETVHKITVVSRPLSCEVCSKKFQFRKALERHQLLHEQNGDSENALKCPHCDQTFLRPGFLDRHVASHFENCGKYNGNGEEKRRMGHPCPCCPRRLSTQAKLKAHLRTSHPPPHLKQRYVCSQCPVRCSNASGLRVHMRVHTGERPFQCQQCSASFKRQTALRKHVIALHPASSDALPGENGTRDSFLKCPNCSSTFRVRSNLVRHFLQVHRRLRRFVCGLCGSRYGQNQDLRRHLKITHEMEAPRIIGSDRKSVDQIYVVPPVADSLPSDHPLVDKIRMIVEEEEQKLNEDNLPQFTASPQQLHLRIQKDEARNSHEPVMEANQNNQVEGNANFLGGRENEKAVINDWNAGLMSHSSFNESRGPEGLKAGKEYDSVLDTLATSPHQKFDSGDISKHSVGKHQINRSGSSGSRNLILDALISSQITLDSAEENVGQTEEEAHGQNFVNSPEVAKEIEDSFCKPQEVNIIMSHVPVASSSHSIMDKPAFKDSGTEKMSAKVRKSTQKSRHSKKSSLILGTYHCGQCGKQFLDSSRLERHYKTHNDMRPYVCSVCGKGFLERFNLKVHMRSHTGERPYKCEVCGKTMRYLKELTDHRRMHLGERPYACEICSKTFLRLRDLQRHSLTHSNEKKYKCPICDKAFARLDHLRVAHMRMHQRLSTVNPKGPKKQPDAEQNGQKSGSNSKEGNEKCSNKKRDGVQNEWYTCRKCTKQFSSKTKLDQHLILHSGQKQHKCETCGRSFALLSYLRAHLNIHRKQEGYIQCPKCPRKFASEETLSVHEEKFHGRIEKMKKFPSSEPKAGRSKDSNTELGDEEKFFMARPGDFDMNLDLEDDMNIQEVALFDPASLSEAERQNTFVYLRVISDDLQLNNEASLIE